MDYVQTGKIKSVLLVSYWNMHCDVPEFQSALKKTVGQLQAAGVSVYLMKDLPHYEFDIHKSVVRYSYKGLDLSSLGMTPAEYQAARQVSGCLGAGIERKRRPHPGTSTTSQSPVEVG